MIRITTAEAIKVRAELAEWASRGPQEFRDLVDTVFDGVVRLGTKVAVGGKQGSPRFPLSCRIGRRNLTFTVNRTRKSIHAKVVGAEKDFKWDSKREVRHDFANLRQLAHARKRGEV